MHSNKRNLKYWLRVPHAVPFRFFNRRPDGSVGMALVLPALTDCRWWFESLLVHSGISSATRRKATGADQKKTFSILQRLRKYRGEEYEKTLKEGKELLNLQWNCAYFNIYTDASSSSNIRGCQRLGGKKVF